MEKKFTVKERERGRNAELQSFVTVFEKAADGKNIPDGWVRFGVASD